jgi:hypothetical protein
MQTCGVKLIPKKLQVGSDLGQECTTPFNKVLLMVMIKLIIGSDLIALESDDIIAAIEI